jgi:hypothetical protein
MKNMGMFSEAALADRDGISAEVFLEGTTPCGMTVPT